MIVSTKTLQKDPRLVSIINVNLNCDWFVLICDVTTCQVQVLFESNSSHAQPRQDLILGASRNQLHVLQPSPVVRRPFLWLGAGFREMDPAFPFIHHTLQQPSLHAPSSGSYWGDVVSTGDSILQRSLLLAFGGLILLRGSPRLWRPSTRLLDFVVLR